KPPWLDRAILDAVTECVKRARPLLTYAVESPAMTVGGVLSEQARGQGVGAAGFEPATFRSQSGCATRATVQIRPPRLEPEARRPYALTMPFCVNCGQENPDVAKFCLACGSPMAAATRPQRILLP